MEKPSEKVTVLIMGPKGVGKTSLRNQFIKGVYGQDEKIEEQKEIETEESKLQITVKEIHAKEEVESFPEAQG